MRLFNKLLKPQANNPDEVRMTLGEHLEELRSRLIKAILAVAVASVVCFFFAGHIQAFLIWPVAVVYRAHGLDAGVHTFTPTEAFMTKLKVAAIVGLILSAPYSLSQIWGFVAAGLYPRERKWVRSFAPVSIVLFFTGALFLIIVVNPLLLNFLLTYETELPDVSVYMPTWLIQGGDANAIKPTVVHSAEEALGGAGSPVPCYQTDPPDPIPQGIAWYNLTHREKRIRLGDQIYRETRLEPIGATNRIQPDLRLGELIPFTLSLAAAFGIGFQVPVVVAFIAAVGLLKASDMAKYRRHVIFTMAVLSALVCPSPDPISMMMLLVPMVVLFEAGLFAARRIERKRAARVASEPETSGASEDSDSFL